jgi:UDP-N-acetylmuramoyl-L-alanyl-D-glutamate--2,6-diaminopimelate ligase
MRVATVTQKSAVELSRIAARVAPLAMLGDASHTLVSDVVYDHRDVREGALFCCVVGQHYDGHDFAAQAVRAGAVAFLCEHSLSDAVGELPQLVVAPGTIRLAMAYAACEFFGDPSASMTTVGITGTNGKTTTSFILRSIFEQAGLSARVIGTLDGARTTPEATVLQRTLATYRSEGVEACAVEVSSHALAQHRVDGSVFKAAVFTNLSQDHLDYHDTMEAYFEAKSALFRPELSKLAVVNADDPYGQRLIEHASIPTIAYSLSDVHDLVVTPHESSFRLGGVQVRLPLGGRFNVYNALGAAVTARALGVSVDAIVAGLAAVPVVPGRFEAQDAGNGVTVIVDFAHTPNGLEEVLQAARSAAKRTDQRVADSSRVVVVFGCGGDRDRGKRPIMGAVAGRYADEVFLTSDNPRSEDPVAITEEIRAGLICATPVHVELDRRRAIIDAIVAAHPGDVVVVAGKGHETTQQFADRVVHFDDREVVRDAIALLRAGRDGARDGSSLPE